MKIGVVGLGSMGYGIAASLLRSGHEVFGSDVNVDAIKRLRAEGGSNEDIAAAAPRLDALVVVVLNAAQAEDVLFGKEGLVGWLFSGRCCHALCDRCTGLCTQRCAKMRGE